MTPKYLRQVAADFEVRKRKNMKKQIFEEAYQEAMRGNYSLSIYHWVDQELEEELKLLGFNLIQPSSRVVQFRDGSGPIVEHVPGKLSWE